jgi:hypothetical protein
VCNFFLKRGGGCVGGGRVKLVSLVPVLVD